MAKKMLKVKSASNKIATTKTAEAKPKKEKGDAAQSEMKVESESVKSDSKAAKRKPSAKEITIEEGAQSSLKRQKVLLKVPNISTMSGKIYVLGENNVGQLGNSKMKEKKTPSPLDIPYSSVDIAAGAMHSVCLTDNGEVLTFGCNDEGALGRVTLNEESEWTPTKVNISEQIVQVSAGDSHTAALGSSGQVYLWGSFRNSNGNVGLVREGVIEFAPVRILEDVKVVKIASGAHHLVCLSEEGVVYTCGCAESGQLGRITEHSNEDGDQQGTLVLLTPDKVPVTDEFLLVDNIWTGDSQTFLKMRDTNIIYGCGLNNYYQLGVENMPGAKMYISNPIDLESFKGRTWSKIDGGEHHTIALDAQGLVYAFGRAHYGTLGLGDNADETSVPTEIPSLSHLKCIYVSSGTRVSFAITDDGSVFSWGMGTTYQLGHGNDDDQYVPKLMVKSESDWKAIKIAGGGQHTLILATPRK